MQDSSVEVGLRTATLRNYLYYVHAVGCKQINYPECQWKTCVLLNIFLFCLILSKILPSVVNRYDVRADHVPADLSKVTDIETLWSEVTRLHPDGVDILVNCAGQRSF